MQMWNSFPPLFQNTIFHGEQALGRRESGLPSRCRPSEFACVVFTCLHAFIVLDMCVVPTPVARAQGSPGTVTMF